MTAENKRKILVISGSTRNNSVNAKIIAAIAELCADKMEFKYSDLTLLPYFNPDLDNEGVDLSVKNFRSEIELADGVLICTPEYVFSLPGILKNAIEWTVSTTVFSDKPVALITASLSGKVAHESLLLIMKTVGAKINEEAALLISGAKTKINKEGKFSDVIVLAQVLKLLKSFYDSLALSA